MNKCDLIKDLSIQMELPLRKAQDIVDQVFGVMSEALLRGDRIEIRGFGSFEIRNYEGYTGRNPKTGETTSVGSKKLPFFRVGKNFRERLTKE